MSSRHAIPDLRPSAIGHEVCSKECDKAQGSEEITSGIEFRREERISMDTCAFVDLVPSKGAPRSYLATVRDVSPFGLGCYYHGPDFPDTQSEFTLYGTFKYKLSWKRLMGNGFMRLGFELISAEKSIFSALESEN